MKLLSKDDLFEIAKIVDNEFACARKTFSAIRKSGYWYLNTNICDGCYMIKIYTDLYYPNELFLKAEVLGEYTDGWRQVTEYTQKRILDFINNMNQ